MRAMDKVNFISMEDGTLEEYAFLDELENQYVKDMMLKDHNKDFGNKSKEAQEKIQKLLAERGT